MSRKLKALGLNMLAAIAILMVNPEAYARLATQEDMGSENLLFERRIQVEADGTYTETVELKVHIITERGKRNRATVPVRYDGSEESLTILEAKTIVGDKEYPVALTSIEDKSIASAAHGFSNTRQVMLSFPYLQTDAVIHLKYQRKCLRPILPGYFSTVLAFWTDESWRQGRHVITSKIPLYLAINDVKQRLSVTQTQVGGGTTIEVLLKAPYLYSIIEERDASETDAETPIVAVSSVSSWQKVAHELIPYYNKIMAQPLPEVLQAILRGAPPSGPLVDRIDYVTSQLAKEFEYMGDWRTGEGRYFPQNLAAVAESRRGDCKDFSTLTVLLLRKMGIKADIAVVHRGTDPYFFDLFDLPSLSAFNHVIVRVDDGGQAKWIDPTNFTSFARGLYSDIAGRKALVLRPQTKGVEMIPDLLPTDYEIITDLALDFTKEQELIRGSLERKGLAAINVTGLGLIRGSRSNADYSIMSHVTAMDRVNDLVLQDYELNSRIVKDQHFKFSFGKSHKELDLMKTTVGVAFSLGAWPHEALLTSIKDRFSDLSIGSLPSRTVQRRVLVHGKLVGNGLACKIASPWIALTRTVKDIPEGVEITEESLVKKATIPNAELYSEAFSDLQKQLLTCFGPMAVIFTLPPHPMAH